MAAVISFISQKGGVGKSTLARALAAVAAHVGIEVFVVDLDVQQQSILRWGDIRVGQDGIPGLAMAAHTSIDEALDADHDCELLIVDAPGQSNAATLRIADRSHVVIAPTGPSLDDLYPTVLLLHELTAANIPSERVAVALCRTLSKSEEDEARNYISKAGYEVLAGSLPERAAYRSAQNLGRAVSETKDLDQRVDTLIESMLQKVMREVTRAKIARNRAPSKKGLRP